MLNATYTLYEGFAEAQDGLGAFRTAARERLATTDWPHLKTEAWRYSDLKALKAEAFAPADAADAKVPAPLVAGMGQLIFVGGHFRADLSATPAFAKKLETADGLALGDDAPALLAALFAGSGLALDVPAGTDGGAYEIVHIAPAEGHSAHARIKVSLAEGASLTLVERFTGDTRAWSNPAMDVTVAKGARLTHLRLIEEGETTLHTGRAHVRVAGGGAYQGFGLMAGGSLTRFEAHVAVEGEEAQVSFDGVMLAGAHQSHDILTHVTHAVGGANSDQVIRAIAASKGHASFQGKVTVAHQAQKTDANQSFKALLLDRTARANAKPELEIYADDVKCSHGATVGELDRKAFHYLTSRGIDPATARRMLVEAFMGDALVRLTDETLMETVSTIVADWMQAHEEGAAA